MENTTINAEIIVETITSIIIKSMQSPNTETNLPINAKTIAQFNTIYNEESLRGPAANQVIEKAIAESISKINDFTGAEMIPQINGLISAKTIVEIISRINEKINESANVEVIESIGAKVIESTDAKVIDSTNAEVIDSTNAEIIETIETIQNILNII